MARLFGIVLACALAVTVGVPLMRAVSKAIPCMLAEGKCKGGDGYATAYFAGLTPIAAPLASRQFSQGIVQTNLNGFDCTFAIAALDDHAPMIPPARRKNGTPDMDWGGGWRAVTVLTATESEDLRSLLAVCGTYWPTDLQKRLTEALANRRMLISGRAPYRQVNLYLPPQDGVGLAARIRFGD